MFNKKIEILSTKYKNLEEQKRFSSYKGKKVFSKSGAYVGKIKDVTYDTKNTITGVIVKSKKTLFLDLNYFSSDTEDLVMLTIEPFINLIGKKVIDSEGKLLGKIIDIDRNKTDNDFKSLIVREKFYKKPFIIPKRHVHVTKENVILKKAYNNN